MMNYLLKSIPGIVFEPMAVILPLWMIIFPLYRKKDKPFFWIIIFAALFMLLWRLFCHSVMVSGRYSSFFIYTTVIFCACFCVKIVPLLRLISRKLKWDFPLLRKLFFGVAIFLIVGFNIGSIIKITKFNKYSSYTQKICCEYLKYDKSSYILHTVEEELNRVIWYTKKKAPYIQSIYSAPEDNGMTALAKHIEKWQNFPEDHYFMFFRKKGEVEPDAENLKIPAKSGTWRIVVREYTSKRKNKEFILAHYKCNNSSRNIEEWNGKIPELPAKNLCVNGDFEKILSGNHLRDMQKYYIKHNVKGYTDLGNRKLPHNWWLSLSSWNSGNPPHFQLESSNPLAGKYSLLMDGSDSKSLAQINCWAYIYNKKCKYNLFVRPEGNSTSQLVIFTTSQNIQTKKYKRTYERKFLLHPGKVYRISGNIPTDTFPEGFRNFCLLLAVRGTITVDQVSLIEY